ncbi:hypothetical protein [Methylobacterium sp. JK268]
MRALPLDMVDHEPARHGRSVAPVPGARPERPGAGGDPRATPVRCRPIEDGDIAGVVRLLARGFPAQPEADWRRGLARHRARALPPGLPRYGYVLVHDGVLVGVLLTLYSVVERDGGHHLRCNLSSWYVEPPFRSYAVLLDNHAMRDRTTTYVNLSPAPHTLAIHAVRGFQTYCRGQFLAFPALARRGTGQSIHPCTNDALARLPPGEARLVTDHLAYGCIGMICSGAEGVGVVLFKWRSLNLRPGGNGVLRVPSLQLVYRSPSLDLASWAGALGRHLLRHQAMPWFVVDANEPVAGVPGRFFRERGSKIFRGAHRPDPGDLTYSEAVLFGR